MASDEELDLSHRLRWSLQEPDPDVTARFHALEWLVTPKVIRTLWPDLARAWDAAFYHPPDHWDAADNFRFGQLLERTVRKVERLGPAGVRKAMMAKGVWLQCEAWVAPPPLALSLAVLTPKVLVDHKRRRRVEIQP